MKTKKKEKKNALRDQINYVVFFGKMKTKI